MALDCRVVGPKAQATQQRPAHGAVQRKAKALCLRQVGSKSDELPNIVRVRPPISFRERQASDSKQASMQLGGLGGCFCPPVGGVFLPRRHIGKAWGPVGQVGAKASLRAGNRASGQETVDYGCEILTTPKEYPQSDPLG
jgi:hypothetical protein